MKEGKKVRRSFWDKGARYYSKSVCGNSETIKGIGNITSEYSAYFDIDDFEATDWEIYKEKEITTSGEYNYGDITLKDNGTHDITFNTKDCNSIIELKENGDIFVKGKLIENDKEVVDGMRELLGFDKIKKESLSNKLRTPFGFDGDWAKAEDIRKAICKFLRESKKITNCKYDFYWLAKEIFGKQLT